MQNGRRPRHYRLRPVKSEAGNVAAFLVALALLVLVALVVYAGVGASLPLA